MNPVPAHALALGLFLACTLAACGEPSNEASSHPPSIIRITAPKAGWAQSIELRTEADGRQSLTLDGVRFELRDPTATFIDWEALGMKEITVTSAFQLDSTVPVEGAFLSVAGKGVEIHDGVLTWGDATLGAVRPGDVVIVDAEGVRIQG